MSLIRAIWNGPFYVGKLTQPISVGSALLKVLEVLWRGLLSIVLLIAGAASGIAAYVTYIGPALFPPPQDSIRGKAFYAANVQAPPPTVRTITALSLYPSMDELEAEPCPDEYPVRVSLFNEGSSSLTNVRFYLEGYLSGYSGNRVENQNGGISDEIILRPNRGITSCYGVETKYATPPKSLNYKIDVWSATVTEE